MIQFVLILVVATLVAIGIGYLIIKFVPLKARPIISILLLVTAGFLSWKIYNGVMEPIKFKAEKEKRYAAVIDQLKLIRDAQEKYVKANRLFAKDANSLEEFIKNGKLAITETKNIEKTVNTGGGITKKISVKQVDTVGYESVSKYFKGRNIDKIFTVTVPGVSKPLNIDVETGTVEKVEGLFVPVFQAKVEKTKVLEGMNKNEIEQEIKAIKNDEVKGTFVSVGSLEEVSLGGNWPPSYDAKDNVKKEDDKK